MTLIDVSGIQNCLQSGNLVFMYFGSLSSLIFEANERPSVLLLTLEPDSVFDETDKLLGMAVIMLESVTVLLLVLLVLSSDFLQAAKTKTRLNTNTIRNNFIFPL